MWDIYDYPQLIRFWWQKTDKNFNPFLTLTCDMLRPAVPGWHTFDSKGGIVQNIAATDASRLQDVQNEMCSSVQQIKGIILHCGI